MGPLAGLVFAILVICGAAQVPFENNLRALAFLALLPAAAILVCVVALRPKTLASMHMAVVVLGFFAGACTLATLTVQERDFRGHSEEHFWQAFQRAEAGLFYRILHPTPPRFLRRFARKAPLELDAQAEARFAELGSKLGQDGEDYAATLRREHLRAQESDAKNAAIAEWAQTHEGFLRTLYQVVRATRLSDAFSSWWFVAILVLLLVNLSACTWQRLKAPRRNIGFIAVHLGVIVTLLGAFIGSQTLRTGAVGLEVGGQDLANRFVDIGSGKDVHLGFSIKLEAFQTVYHKELLAAFTKPGTDAILCQRHFKIAPGRVRQLDGGSLTFTVQEVMPEAALESEVIEDPAGKPNPAARVVVFRSKDDMEGQWLFADSDHTFVHSSNAVKVRYAGTVSPAQAEQLARQAAASALGSITATNKTTGETTQIAAMPGQSAAFGGYQIHVAECYADFTKKHALPLDLQYPNHPAAKLVLAKGDETEQRWVFARVDFDAMRPPKFGEIKLSLHFDLWRSPARHKFLLVGPKQDMSIYPISEGKVGPAVPVQLGKPARLPGASHAILVSQALERAQVRTEVVEYRPVSADPFQNQSEPAIKLRVKTRSGEHARWLLANTEQGVFRVPQGPTFVFADNTEKKPKAWKARLGFYEEGEKLLAKVVKVNHPATYRGFIFYQWDADHERPGYAGIRVVRDPGWPFVKTGLTMVIAGIVFIFYVQPFLRRRAAAGRP